MKYSFFVFERPWSRIVRNRNCDEQTSDRECDGYEDYDRSHSFRRRAHLHRRCLESPLDLGRRKPPTQLQHFFGFWKRPWGALLLKLAPNVQHSSWLRYSRPALISSVRLLHIFRRGLLVLGWHRSSEGESQTVRSRTFGIWRLTACDRFVVCTVLHWNA